MYNQIRAKINDQISQQYPNLPDANKDALVERELGNALKTQKSSIDEQIKGVSSYFKSQLKDDKGNTYPTDLDPWFWMRFSRNIVEKGYPADEFKDGQAWDNHMFAPGGRPITPDLFHAYFIAYLFKFLHFFNSSLEIINVSFFVPIILVALSIIPAFFIARRFGGNFGGFIAGLMVAINPASVSRTVSADTDANNILFPLLIAWLFLEAFESEKPIKRLSLCAISSFIVGLYAFTWGGWWYIFDFILASSVIYIVYFTIVNRSEIKKEGIDFIKQPQIRYTFLLIIMFIAFSGIFITLFQDFYTFRHAPFEPMGFATLKDIKSVWPNVFTTVAEQNPASLNQVISTMGGPFLFFIGLMGMVLILTSPKSKNWWFLALSALWYLVILFIIKPEGLQIFLVLITIPLLIMLFIEIKNPTKDIDIKYASIIILWFISTVYASTMGVRFSLLLVPAFSIVFGIALGFIYKYLSRLIITEFKINKVIVKTTVIIILGLLIIGPWASSKAIARNSIPMVNDAWFNSLTKIKVESKPDAIINSWWDYGHWFKYIGDRAVTFDGTSQNTPQAYWIGKVLLTDNEKLAAGILRMLDCSGCECAGGTKAFSDIFESNNDTPKTIEILNEIVPLKKDEAISVLIGYGFNDSKINSVLSNTHCNAPENYFITSDDMVGKSGVWAHFGSWDFDKALMYDKFKTHDYENSPDLYKKFLQDRFNFTEEEAKNMYYSVESLASSNDANNWISPWPSYIGAGGCEQLTKYMVRCDLIQGASVFVNLTNMQADVPTKQGILHPNPLVYVAGEEVITKEFNNSIGFGLTLVPVGDSYKVIMSSSELAPSMFTRLYYLKGHGLRYFKPFSYERSFNGNEIYTWKVDWDGLENNIVEEFIKPEIVEENISSEESATETNKTPKESVTEEESNKTGDNISDV